AAARCRSSSRTCRARSSAWSWHRARCQAERLPPSRKACSWETPETARGCVKGCSNMRPERGAVKQRGGTHSQSPQRASHPAACRSAVGGVLRRKLTHWLSPRGSTVLQCACVGINFWLEYILSTYWSRERNHDRGNHGHI